APLAVEAVAGGQARVEVPAVVAVVAAVQRREPLVILAQGGGELPLAQAGHVTEPDSGPVGTGAAEGGGLAGLGNAGLQTQLLLRPLVGGALQLDAVTELMGEMAGGEIPAHIQLGTDPVFGE